MSNDRDILYTALQESMEALDAYTKRNGDRFRHINQALSDVHGHEDIRYIHNQYMNGNLTLEDVGDIIGSEYVDDFHAVIGAKMTYKTLNDVYKKVSRDENYKPPKDVIESLEYDENNNILLSKKLDGSSVLQLNRNPPSPPSIIKNIISYITGILIFIFHKNLKYTIVIIVFIIIVIAPFIYIFYIDRKKTYE